MPLNGISIQKSATSMTVVGGTAAVHESDGLEVKNGIHVVDTSVTSKVERPHATFKSKPFALQSDGSYSKGKLSVNYTKPKTLASGATSYQVVRVEFEIHPELTNAEILDLRLIGAQLITDAETDGFFNNGSIK